MIHRLQPIGVEEHPVPGDGGLPPGDPGRDGPAAQLIMAPASRFTLVGRRRGPALLTSPLRDRLASCCALTNTPEELADRPPLPALRLNRHQPAQLSGRSASGPAHPRIANRSYAGYATSQRSSTPEPSKKPWPLAEPPGV